MRLHPDGATQSNADQAEKLRQLRRSETSPRLSLDSQLRVVLLSELPNSDCGARFAFHLANALSQIDPAAPDQATLLLDLAPAASRLPYVLADQLPAHSYASVWHDLAAGHEFSPSQLRTAHPLAIAAAPQMHALELDQQARSYEDLLRHLRQQAKHWKWMVIIAVDHVLPIDRSYWLAADDIVLLGSHGATARQQHATALVSRQLDHRQAPRLWTIPKQSTSWLWPSRGPTLIHYRTDLSLTARELPAVHWTECRNSYGLRNGSLADKRLIRQARAIAENLCRPNAWQTAPANGECAASMKKIQLSTLCASIQREPGIVRA